MRPLIWLATSLADLRRFPALARRVAGFQLWRVQLGLDPNDWKPMPEAGAGVREIRVHTGTEHRVLYVAKFAEAVYVLHAFEKKSRKTPRRDIEIAARRLRSMLAQRKDGS